MYNQLYIIYILVLYNWLILYNYDFIIGGYMYFETSILIIGIILFMVSEIMLFISVFWTVFYSTIVNNDVCLYCNPIRFPGNLIVFYNMCIDMYYCDIIFVVINTIILFLSGLLIIIFIILYTTQYYLYSIVCIILIIIFGVLFIFEQMFEFNIQILNIWCGYFATTYYIIDNIHLIHIFIGINIYLYILYLLIYYINVNNSYIIILYNIYWHMVDIIWVLLFKYIYINIINIW